jgi:CubicO group peptidase (beta-lactamase class C family)
MNIQKLWDNWNDGGIFSGVFYVTGENGVLFEKQCGFRNRSEGLPNNMDTAFGVASGTKFFTGLAVCKLIDSGRLSLEDKIWDILLYDLGQVDKKVTVRHLLTHTSGIGDYIDEEASDSAGQLRALYARYPVYLWERLKYYLQMITPLPKKFEPGSRYSYSNAGFVLLGSVIEAVSRNPYQQYVADDIITPLDLQHTGFYRTDALPANTALGYMEEGGRWRTNTFSLPVIGGSDGGLYTCAQDLDKLWRAIFAGRVLSEDMLRDFLNPHVMRSENKSYGLGVYRYDIGGTAAYYAVGSDFGVDMFTAYFPKQKITASALGNTEVDTFPLLKAMLEEIIG